MRGPSLILSGVVVSLLATAALAETSVDKSFTTTSDDCNGVHWTAAAIRMHPTIAVACQGVETREGKTYVRFEGTVDKNEIKDGGKLAVKFKDGSKDPVVLNPPADTNVYIDGKKTAVADLKRGDKLNFYIGEERLAAMFPDETKTEYVAVPIVYREVVREPAPEQAASLPHTASDLPLMALGGFMLLGMGAGMSVFRMKK
jgi:hypothetical protein